MVCERVAFEGLRAAAGAPRDQQQAQQVQAGTDDDRVERGVDDSDDTDLEEGADSAAVVLMLMMAG
jgi:hypothetical protein